MAISLYNFEGAPRRFTRQELLRTLNGFVAEIGGRKEYGSFDRFRSVVTAGRVEDTVAAGQRIASYSRPNVQLGLTHSIAFGAVKYILVDGKLQRRPRFEATGMNP